MLGGIFGKKLLANIGTATPEEVSSWMAKEKIQVDATFLVTMDNTKLKDLSLIAIAALYGNTTVVSSLLEKGAKPEKASTNGIDAFIAATLSDKCEETWNVLFEKNTDPDERKNSLLQTVNRIFDFWLKAKIESLKLKSLENMFACSQVQEIAYDFLSALYRNNKHSQLPESAMMRLNSAFVKELKKDATDKADDDFILVLLNHLKELDKNDALFFIDVLASRFVRKDLVGSQVFKEKFLSFAQRYVNDIYIQVLVAEFIVSKFIQRTTNEFYKYLKKIIEIVNTAIKIPDAANTSQLHICRELVLQRLKNLIQVNPTINEGVFVLDMSAQSIENWFYLAKEYQLKLDDKSVSNVLLCYKALLDYLSSHEKAKLILENIKDYLSRIPDDTDNKFFILMLKIEIEIKVFRKTDMDFLVNLFFNSPDDDKQRFINFISNSTSLDSEDWRSLFSRNLLFSLLDKIIEKVKSNIKLFEFYYKITELLYDAQYYQESFNHTILIYQALMRIDVKKRPEELCDSCVKFIEDHGFSNESEYLRNSFLAEYYFGKNDHEKSLRYYSEALELGKQQENSEQSISFAIQGLLKIAKDKKYYQAWDVIIKYYMETQQFSLAAVACIEVVENEKAKELYQYAREQLDTLYAEKNLVVIAYRYSKLPESYTEVELIKLLDPVFTLNESDFESQSAPIPLEQKQIVSERYFSMSMELLESNRENAIIALKISGAFSNGKALIKLSDLFSEKLDAKNYELILSWLGNAVFANCYPQGKDICPRIIKLLEAMEIDVEEEIRNRMIQILALAIYQQINFNYQFSGSADWKCLLEPISLIIASQHEAASFLMWVYLNHTQSRPSHITKSEHSYSPIMSHYELGRCHAAKNEKQSAFVAYSKFLGLLKDPKDQAQDLDDFQGESRVQIQEQVILPTFLALFVRGTQKEEAELFLESYFKK